MHFVGSTTESFMKLNKIILKCRKYWYSHVISEKWPRGTMAIYDTRVYSEAILTLLFLINSELINGVEQKSPKQANLVVDKGCFSGQWGKKWQLKKMELETNGMKKGWTWLKNAPYIQRSTSDGIKS